MKIKKIIKKNSIFMIAALVMLVFMTFVVTSVNALADTTRPTILYISPMNAVSPSNNEQEVDTNVQITVMFSEDMDKSTINKNTFTVMQRTTPESGEYRSLAIPGVITYNKREATFTSIDKFGPNQVYGNVFTVTVTKGVKDLAGNSISKDYFWSFTTGGDPFNTGSTTSQLDQSGTPITGKAVVPESEDAPIVAQTSTQNKFSWNWVIGIFAGMLLFLLLLLLFIPAKKSEKDEKIMYVTKDNPFGDIHPVRELEGIGPEYNKALLAMGIENTEQLWKGNSARIAQKTGAPLSSVKSWQSMAELASVHDIGPQYAELLERSGIHSINQLKNYTPTELLKRVQKKQESLDINIQGNVPGHSLVKNWIDEARSHKFGVSGQTA